MWTCFLFCAVIGLHFCLYSDSIFHICLCQKLASVFFFAICDMCKKKYHACRRIHGIIIFMFLVAVEMTLNEASCFWSLSCVHLAITMLKSLLHHLHNDTQLFFFVNGDHSMLFIVQGTALVNVQKNVKPVDFPTSGDTASYILYSLLQLVVLTSLVRVQLLPPTLVFV